MRLDFKRDEIPGPLPGERLPVIVPVLAATGEAIEDVLEASVVSKHAKFTELMLRVIVRRKEA